VVLTRLRNPVIAADLDPGAEVAMPRYLFNIRNGDQLETTLEAVELADLDAVRQEALASGREIVAELLRSDAALNSALSRSFEVTDETGNVVLTLPFGDCVRDAAPELVEPETHPGFLSPQPGSR
jgi:hypothetical protein